jgi:hypothetical protein
MWGKAFAGRKKQHGKSGYTLVMPTGRRKGKERSREPWQ